MVVRSNKQTKLECLLRACGKIKGKQANAKHIQERNASIQHVPNGLSINARLRASTLGFQ